MLICMPAPNRYHKMMPEYIPFDTFEQTLVNKKDDRLWYLCDKKEIKI